MNRPKIDIGMDYPSWFPGKPLSAKDLIGLENFLASRFNFPQKGFGVIKLNDTDVIPVINENGDVNIKISNIEGITRQGHYISIEQETFENVVIGKEGRLLDLEIEVNSLDQSSPNKPTPKFLFNCKIVSQDDDKYTHHDGSLYLGRYNCIRDDFDGKKDIELSLRKYPPVYTLSAINFRKDDWIKWTNPFVNKINMVYRELTQRDVGSFSHTQIVALTEANSLIYHWYEIPLPPLVQKLNYLNWLLKLLSRNESNINAGEILEKNRVDLINNIKSLPYELGEILFADISPLANENLLLEDFDYEKRWNRDEGNLEIVFKHKFEHPKFQIELDFTNILDQIPDCNKDIRSRLQDQNGRRIANPDLSFFDNQGPKKRVYKLEINQHLEENSMLILYQLSYKNPRISIKNY